MNYLRTVGPATEPVSLVEAKAHLHIDAGNTNEDDYITTLITAARERAEVVQNRAYITQTWELWLDGFPEEDYIKLPMPPLQSVTSIKYYDTDDVVATMSSSDYYVDVKRTPGRVSLNYDGSWPPTTLRPANSVCVTYIAGYGASGSNVPQDIRQAIKLLVSSRYTGDTKQVELDEQAALRLLGLRRLVPA